MWNMASTTEELKFPFYLILINFNVNSQTWPVAAILNSTELDLTLFGELVKKFPDGACLCIWSGWVWSHCWAIGPAVGEKSWLWSGGAGGRTSWNQLGEMGTQVCISDCNLGGHGWSVEDSAFSLRMHTPVAHSSEKLKGGSVLVTELLWQGEPTRNTAAFGM